ncbi:MAG: hypothetical protein HUU55_16465 [Myxococcales bacterium]|nr:hypothetical protein [Myxococcales bacterium]
MTTPSLAELDEIHQDTLVLYHFLEDRPLKGLTGFVDWRINGKLSRLVLNGFATGAAFDTILMPVSSRILSKRLLLTGLGVRKEYSPDVFRLVCLQTLQTLLKLHVTSFALALPGIEGLKIAPRLATEIFLTALHQSFVTPRYNNLDYDIRFVFPPSHADELGEIVKNFERQYRRR